MITYLDELCRQRWPDWFGAPYPGLLWVMHAPGLENPHDNVLLFALSQEQGHPLIVAKLCRHPRFNHTVRHEFHQLSEAWQRSDQAAASLPRPLALAQHGHDLASVTTYCPGRPLLQRLRRLNPGHPDLPALFACAARWLGRLHTTTALPQTEAVEPHLFQAVVTAYRFRFNPTPAQEEAVSQVCRALSATTPSHSVLLQGDFWPGNCLLAPQGQDMAVVDWQFSRRAADASLDVYLFLLAAARELSPSPDERAQARLAAQVIASWLSRFIPDYCAAYESAAQVNGRWQVMPPIAGMLATCLELATRPYRAFGKTQTDSRFWLTLFDELRLFLPLESAAAFPVQP